MSLPAIRPLLIAGLSIAFSMSAFSHEDDPKVLDRIPPVPGSGFRAANGNLALVGGNQAAAAMLGFDAEGVILRSWMTLSDIGYPTSTGNDCWGYTSPSGREYAIIGTSEGTSFIEVTNPDAPVLLQQIDGPSSLWRDMKVYADFAYIVSEGGGGIQVVDMSNIDSGIVSLTGSITGQGTDATHNVVIDETSGFLYRTGGGGEGLRIYSLQNPANPSFVGSWPDRYVHDAQVVTYTSGPLSGRQIAYCCAGLGNGGTDTGLSVVDVTNKNNPVVVSQLAYPSRAYSHQGWLSADRQYFYLGDELDEGATVATTTTQVFDVSDPDNVIYVGQFDNGDPAIGHNMYERGGLLFQANYTSGLRIFDIASNPTSPAEVAYFDTAPNSDATSFNGLWSCYVGFGSGTVIGSDLESGLFVLTVEEPEIEIALAAPAPDLLSPSGGTTVPVTITELVAGALVGSSPTLVYDIGAGNTTLPLIANGGTSYSAVFPSLPCAAAVDWFVTASSTGGQTVATSTESTLAADSVTLARSDDMESAAGWTSGAAGDTATTGIWTRGNPIGTEAQPEDDNSAAGAQCWFTGQGSNGGSLGEEDIDGGETTLLTPSIDMSALDDPAVSYYRWYNNSAGASPNADVFDISISNNGGATWTLVERVGPAGTGTSGGWIQHRFNVTDFVTPTAQMRMRFVASDLNDGSIVEAAIDDFEVVSTNCGDGIGSAYCAGVANSTGVAASIIANGSNVTANNNLTLVAIDLPLATNGYFVVSSAQAFVANPGGSQGNLCVGANTGRYIAQLGNSGLFGQISLIVDNTAIPQPNGVSSTLPGDTWNFQCWYRDANPAVTSNFTRGYSVTFQ